MYISSRCSSFRRVSQNSVKAHVIRALVHFFRVIFKGPVFFTQKYCQIQFGHPNDLKSCIRRYKWEKFKYNFLLFICIVSFRPKTFKLAFVPWMHLRIDCALTFVYNWYKSLKNKSTFDIEVFHVFRVFLNIFFPCSKIWNHI